MKARKELIYAIMLILCVCLLFYSVVFLKGREYYFVSLAIILLGIIVFLFRFENRKPTIAELTIISVMCAIAVVARISFFMLPQIKPIAALIIITGISLGAEAGFITGAMSAFISNFYFGQGSWTPFQMFALGLVGFFAGILFQKIPVNKITTSIYGFLSIVVLYGGIVDINTLFFTVPEKNFAAFCAVYGSGFFMNAIFGVSTVVFLVLLYRPVLNKLTRVKIKYNLIPKNEMTEANNE